MMIILILSLAVTVFFIVYGAFCLIAPRRVILLHAEYSTVVSRESADSRWVRTQFRVVGIIFMGTGGLATMMIVSKLGS
jgi:hypothetical protein